MERRPHCSPQQPIQACLTPALVSPFSRLPLTCLPFQYVILDVAVAVKGLILFGVWWHGNLLLTSNVANLYKSYQKSFFSRFPGIIRTPKHAARNQLRMGSVLSLSQIISNRITYCLRLYPYALCVALLFTYIILIYFCMPYIFLGWCSPSMWPLVLYLIQNWLFMAKHFPFILCLNFLVLRLFS